MSEMVNRLKVYFLLKPIMKYLHFRQNEHKCTIINIRKNYLRTVSLLWFWCDTANHEIIRCDSYSIYIYFQKCTYYKLFFLSFLVVHFLYLSTEIPIKWFLAIWLIASFWESLHENFNYRELLQTML